MLKISLSAGHGGFGVTPGKRTPDGSMYEWDFNSAVVKYMMQRLALYQDVAILRLDDPTGKTDIPLQTRSDRSNEWNADIHMDIHANAFGASWNDANGIETYVYSGNQVEAVKLATVVQRNLVSSTGRENRGVKFANFHMLRETKATAILVECGFMTNKQEAELLKSDAYRQKVANSIVDSLVQVRSLKKRVVDAPKTPFQKAIDKGIIKGYPNGEYGPNDPLTRSQLATILDRLGLLD